MPAKRILLGSAVAWLAILPLAVANGVLREFVLVPRWGPQVAQPISGLLLIGCIAVVASMLVAWIGPTAWTTLLAIGLGWAVATFCFELAMSFGQGLGWEGIARQYSFADCNLWPLVMLWLVVAPILLFSLRRRLRTPARSGQR